MACLVVSRVFQETSIVYANSLLSVNAFQTSRRTHAECTALPNAARGGARQATTWHLIGVIYFGSLSSDSNERPSLLLQHLWRGQDWVWPRTTCLKDPHHSPDPGQCLLRRCRADARYTRSGSHLHPFVRSISRLGKSSC